MILRLRNGQGPVSITDHGRASLLFLAGAGAAGRAGGLPLQDAAEYGLNVLPRGGAAAVCADHRLAPRRQRVAAEGVGGAFST